MSRPGIEPGPPAWEASTLEKSHLDSLSAGYSEPLLGLRRNIQPLHASPQCMRRHGLDWVWPKALASLVSKRSELSSKPRDSDHVGVTTYRQSWAQRR